MRCNAPTVSECKLDNRQGTPGVTEPRDKRSDTGPVAVSRIVPGAGTSRADGKEMMD